MSTSSCLWGVAAAGAGDVSRGTRSGDAQAGAELEPGLLLGAACCQITFITLVMNPCELQRLRPIIGSYDLIPEYDKKSYVKKNLLCALIK